DAMLLAVLPAAPVAVRRPADHPFAPAPTATRPASTAACPPHAEPRAPGRPDHRRNISDAPTRPGRCPCSRAPSPDWAPTLRAGIGCATQPAATHHACAAPA